MADAPDESLGVIVLALVEKHEDSVAFEQPRAAAWHELPSAAPHRDNERTLRPVNLRDELVGG